MTELIKELMGKANLDETQAAKASEVAINFLKSKVPPVFQDKIEDMLAGNFDMSNITGMMGNPMDMLKGMFGKK